MEKTVTKDPGLRSSPNIREKHDLEVLRERIAVIDEVNEGRVAGEWPEPFEFIFIPLDVARRLLEALEKQ